MLRITMHRYERSRVNTHLLAQGTRIIILSKIILYNLTSAQQELLQLGFQPSRI